MDKFIQDVSSVYWWMAVFFVGILINLVSAYLKPSTDTALGKVFSWWRNRTLSQRRSHEALLALLKGDKDQQTLALVDANRHKLNALFYFMFFISSSLMLVQTIDVSLLHSHVSKFVFSLWIGFVIYLMAQGLSSWFISTNIVNAVMETLRKEPATSAKQSDA